VKETQITKYTYRHKDSCTCGSDFTPDQTSVLFIY